MAQPIEEAAMEATQNHHPTTSEKLEDLPEFPAPGHGEHERTQNQASENSTEPPAQTLLRAQSEFIKAQSRYIHNADLQALASAQEVFISAQAYVLSTLGVV